MTSAFRLAEGLGMAVRLAALFPRAVVVVLIWVLATAAFTYAADTQLGPSTPAPSAAAKTPVLIVPSVVGQAYVFAKGTLEDAGFAWKVVGPVHGYAGNTVVAQVPEAGTRVLDTGAPTVVLHLVLGSYGQHGAPSDSSSYPGTRIELADLASTRTPAAPRVKPARKPAVKPRAKPVVKPKRAHRVRRRTVARPSRPPAFHAAGAPKEPLDEITLSARAQRLQAWLAKNPKRTDANVHRWLYQHAWIVTGAQFGWSHGAQALETLIAADRHVERIWGIGHRSEAVARAALSHVRREARRG